MENFSKNSMSRRTSPLPSDIKRPGLKDTVKTYRLCLLDVWSVTVGSVSLMSVFVVLGGSLIGHGEIGGGICS